MIDLKAIKDMQEVALREQYGKYWEVPRRLIENDIPALVAWVERCLPIFCKLRDGRCACITHEGDPQNMRCDICSAAKQLLSEVKE